jgi:succinate-semialdehyde dehydrogenase/glutarate-semialdehyde dehydrogenase
MHSTKGQVMADKSSPLLKEKAFVGGEWIAALSGKTFDVVNPANGQVIARVPDMNENDAKNAVDAAHKAFPAWKALTGKERSKILYKWYQAIVDNADELARLMTLEQGKPLAEAKAEVLGGAAFVEWFAEEAKRAYGDFIPAHKADARIIVSKEPIGVAAAITPWNFPSSMITRKVPPALAAGCTVVLKPAEDTPLSALALAALLQQSGAPAGIFNIVTTSEAPAVGNVLTGDNRVKKISFTGSTEVGRILMKQASAQIKKISLELGGNAPFIIFPTCDLDKAVAGTVACKFRNAGQTCISANRIYVHSSIYKEFTAKLLAKVKDIHVGPGDQQGVTMGPLINVDGLKKVEELVADAVKGGASVLTGGRAHALGGTFYEPTILTGMTDSMRITKEEIFGPVAALFAFEDEDEVISRANATEFGLSSYIYSQDYSQIWRVSEALEYGMVAVNEPLLSTELAPFGGVKHSGLGREGSKYGLEEFMEVKYRLFGGL